jgi:hypothetical protein
MRMRNMFANLDRKDDADLRAIRERAERIKVRATAQTFLAL